MTLVPQMPQKVPFGLKGKKEPTRLSRGSSIFFSTSDLLTHLLASQHRFTLPFIYCTTLEN